MMKQFNPILLMFHFILFSFPLLARTPEELAELALQKAPEMLVNKETIEMRSLEVKQSRLWKNPEFTIQGGRVREGADHAQSLELNLMQALTWPGLRGVETKRISLEEAISKLDLEKAKLRIYHETLLVALELGYLEMIHKNNEERRKRFGSIKTYLDSKTIVSDNDKIEASMIQGQMLLVDQYLFEVKTKMMSLKSRIKRLTGVEVEHVDLSFKEINFQKSEKFLASLKEGLEWRRGLTRVEVAQSELKKAQLEGRPEVQVGVNYRVERLKEENEFIQGVLSLTLPLWDRGQYRESIARANLRKEEAIQRKRELDLLNLFEEYYQKMRLSFHQGQKFNLSYLKKLKKEIREAENSFKKGRISAVTLLSHDNLVSESMSLTFKARFDYYVNLSELSELIGKKMELR